MNATGVLDVARDVGEMVVSRGEVLPGQMSADRDEAPGSDLGLGTEGDSIDVGEIDRAGGAELAVELGPILGVDLVVQSVVCALLQHDDVCGQLAPIDLGRGVQLIDVGLAARSLQHAHAASRALDTGDVSRAGDGWGRSGEGGRKGQTERGAQPRAAAIGASLVLSDHLGSPLQ